MTRKHFEYAASDLAERHNVGDIDTADFLTLLYWANDLFSEFGPQYDSGRFISETLRRAGFDSAETARRTASEIRWTRGAAVTLCETIAAHGIRQQM